MDQNKAKVLVIVEGGKTDVRLMHKLFDIYGINQNHVIVSYNTNIYVLYGQMFSEGHPEDYDILSVLKSREKDPAKKKIFDDLYSDILLIFDLDPHDPQFSKEKIEEMVTYFTESSDMGKLYLNYPMVEAFYHMKIIPDPYYESYIVSMEELLKKEYKMRVHRENRNHSYEKFAVDRTECNLVIHQNISKGFFLLGKSPSRNELPDTAQILETQLKQIKNQSALSVLCTCVFYIPEYNPHLIEED